MVEGATPDEAKKAHITSRNKSRDIGKARHTSLEDYVRECLRDTAGKPKSGSYGEIQPFVDWSVQNVKRFIFTENNCFSEKLWIGGIADIGMELLDGKIVIGDHKNSTEAYFDQFIQCATYDVQLMENGRRDADGNLLGDWKGADGYVIFPFRSNPFTPEFVWCPQQYREVVPGIVAVYKLKETRVSKSKVKYGRNTKTA